MSIGSSFCSFAIMFIFGRFAFLLTKREKLGGVPVFMKRDKRNNGLQKLVSKKCSLLF